MPGDPSKDVVQARELRLTWVTGIGAAVVTIGTAINPVFDAVIGKNAPAWVKAIIFITAILGWVLLSIADMASRAYATAHASAAVPPPGSPAAPGTLTVTSGVDDPGWTLIAMSPDGTQALLTKPGQPLQWVPIDDVTS